MKHLTTSILSIPLFFTPLAFGEGGLACNQKIPADGIKFDFSKLDKTHSVWVIDRDLPPATYNTTWTLNICRPLKHDSKQDNSHQCPSSTNICGIKRSWIEADDPDKEHEQVEDVIPLAGSWKLGKGQTLSPTWTRLKTLNPNEEGLQMELRGGVHDNTRQKAVIHFLCDREALERGDEEKEEEEEENQKRDDEGDSKEPERSGNDLTFISYDVVQTKKEPVKVLRLDWKTKYACEDYDGTQKVSSSWGFFTWLFVIFFMGTAAYLIFGSWLNYNRYGARGWDLLPHGDTIRDIPYLVKDWGKKVVDTVSGPGSRGGYSAV